MQSPYYLRMLLTGLVSLWLVGAALAAETYTYDEKDVTKSSMQGTIKTASIDTGNAKRDEHLRSADCFDATKFPDIKFQTTRVEKKGDGYVMVGPLTIRDVTKEVTMPFTVTGKVVDPRGKERIGFEASLKIKRKDFGVSWDKTMDNGSLIVSDDIDIELLVQAIKN
ncbi:MAG: polyisoprenoid-binding protein [Candidatus Tectomicrobia bacterium]|uniref:Polyisoprenoid-binding protein n=1 Tax=Tectimicrobiota bacterium TaxID=2528274 RepID=A0A938AZG3_UNCTE|nr:polyisoprenoid-binding protein [Candidatus Tectomicrobia bacterium]